MSRARDRADGVLHNRTHEDTDGGRESIVTFKGEQSGGEISTLAQIQASHDGTADDEGLQPEPIDILACSPR